MGLTWVKHESRCLIDVDPVGGSAVGIVEELEPTKEVQKCCSVMAWSSTRHGHECALSTSTPSVNDKASDWEEAAAGGVGGDDARI